MECRCEKRDDVSDEFQEIKSAKIQRFTIEPVETNLKTNINTNGSDDSNTKWSSSDSWREFEILELKTNGCWRFRWKAWPCLRTLRTSFLVSSNEKLFSKFMKSQFGGYETERQRHLTTFPESVHPFSDFRWTWDIFMTVTLIVTLVLQPLQIAFYSDSISHLNSALLNSSACLIFLVDILLNFRTGYIGQDSDEVILDSHLTSMHYFKTWFWVDFVSAIPFDLIYIAIEDINPNGHTYFKYFRLLELLKILRLARIVRNLTKIQQAHDIRPHYGRLVNLLTLMFLVLHWLACMHYLVADLTHGTGKQQSLSWVSEMDLWNHPVWEKYLHCILRALSNMACAGYGYAAPRSPEDVVCTIICILIGAVWFALFIANVSNIILNLDAPHKKYDETLGHILEYMKFKHMPKDLQSRVENYFEQRYRHNLFNEEEILGNVSSVLRAQLQMFNCQHLVRRLPIFQRISNEVVHEIVSALKAEVYLPHDIIVWENTIGDSMYFIQSGTVEVLTTNGKVVNHLHDGNFFGEMALLTNDRRRVASVVATTRCDVYSLHQTEFERIISIYPEVFDDILAVAQDRARQMTVEQTNLVALADKTIRKPCEKETRLSVAQAFSEDAHNSNLSSLRNSAVTKEPPRLRKYGIRPVRKSLEEILNIKPVGSQAGNRTVPNTILSINTEPAKLSILKSTNDIVYTDEELLTPIHRHSQQPIRINVLEPINLDYH